MSEGQNATSPRVSGLWRFPVKSMQGQALTRLALLQRGVAEDRLYAVYTSDRKIGSGKNTRRFRRIDGLLNFSVEVEDEAFTVIFPDGQRLRADDSTINNALSAALGQPLTLEREADISHHDAGPVHIVTTASLAWLQARLPGSQIDPRRFRANMLVAAEGEGHLERSWIGKQITIGTATLIIEGDCERCVMATMAQKGLPEDAAILRVLASEAGNCFGVYARVAVPGTISQNDRLIMK